MRCGCGTKLGMNKYTKHYEEAEFIPAKPTEVFNFSNDHMRFSSHMTKSSWMMGGGKMDVSVDKGQGRQVGSHIRLSGKAFGIKLFLDEVVTRHDPPFVKTWETVGIPKLLIIGQYEMGVEIKPQGSESHLRVFINYELPSTNAWFGKLLGGFYAKWCVREMIKGVQDHFLDRKR